MMPVRQVEAKVDGGIFLMRLSCQDEQRFALTHLLISHQRVGQRFDSRAAFALNERLLNVNAATTSPYGGEGPGPVDFNKI